jgi:hypothetical protein
VQFKHSRQIRLIHSSICLSVIFLDAVVEFFFTVDIGLAWFVRLYGKSKTTLIDTK